MNEKAGVGLAALGFLHESDKHVSPSRLVRLGPQVWLGNSQAGSGSSLGASQGWVLSLPYRTCVSCFPFPPGLGQRTGFS